MAGVRVVQQQLTSLFLENDDRIECCLSHIIKNELNHEAPK